MSTRAHHLNRTTRLSVGVAVAAVFGALLGAPTGTAATSAYNYPIKPFTAEHPVRGAFGDPRTLFSSPPTSQDALYGGGSFRFHFGVDISAPDGTGVYPVASGSVSRVDEEMVEVSSDSGRAFEYWHIAAAVHRGQKVTAYRTVLGRVLRGAHHVHLSEVVDSHYVNPLQRGHLTPYTDGKAPAIASISVHKEVTVMVMPGMLHGPVDFVVEAYDTPNLDVPGIWGGMPVAPALLTWSVRDMRFKTVVGTTTAIDFRRWIPDDADFWRYYERGSYQNMSVFGHHYSYRQPGRYLYRLTRRPFDTASLKDGVYDLVVTAADIRGNESSASLRITVHNGPGWIGS